MKDTKHTITLENSNDLKILNLEIALPNNKIFTSAEIVNEDDNYISLILNGGDCSTFKIKVHYPVTLPIPEDDHYKTNYLSVSDFTRGNSWELFKKPYTKDEFYSPYEDFIPVIKNEEDLSNPTNNCIVMNENGNLIASLNDISINEKSKLKVYEFLSQIDYVYNIFGEKHFDISPVLLPDYESMRINYKLKNNLKK